MKARSKVSKKISIRDQMLAEIQAQIALKQTHLNQLTKSLRPPWSGDPAAILAEIRETMGFLLRLKDCHYAVVLNTNKDPLQAVQTWINDARQHIYPIEYQGRPISAVLYDLNRFNGRMKALKWAQDFLFNWQLKWSQDNG